jgi:hypothetical protein
MEFLKLAAQSLLAVLDRFELLLERFGKILSFFDLLVSGSILGIS